MLLKEVEMMEKNVMTGLTANKATFTKKGQKEDFCKRRQEKKRKGKGKGN